MIHCSEPLCFHHIVLHWPALFLHTRPIDLSPYVTVVCPHSPPEFRSMIGLLLLQCSVGMSSYSCYNYSSWRVLLILFSIGVPSERLCFFAVRLVCPPPLHMLLLMLTCHPPHPPPPNHHHGVMSICHPRIYIRRI